MVSNQNAPTCVLLCEYCGRSAAFVDSVTDPYNSRPGEIAYRPQFLCLVHGMERKAVNTSRVQALHPDSADGWQPRT